jgi:hypothetical protein
MILAAHNQLVQVLLVKEIMVEMEPVALVHPMTTMAVGAAELAALGVLHHIAQA